MIARPQHVGAAELVDRRPLRQVGPQLQGLMLAQFGMQTCCRPTDFPTAFVADQVELSVVGPGPVFGQVPGVAVVHRSGVFGEARAEHLCVQMRGLQPGPGGVECGAGVVGPVGQLGRAGGVAGGQLDEELFVRTGQPSRRAATPHQ